jgi:hypothetical protein
MTDATSNANMPIRVVPECNEFSVDRRDTARRGDTAERNLANHESGAMVTER